MVQRTAVRLFQHWITCSSSCEFCAVPVSSLLNLLSICLFKLVFNKYCWFVRVSISTFVELFWCSMLVLVWSSMVFLRSSFGSLFGPLVRLFFRDHLCSHLVPWIRVVLFHLLHVSFLQLRSFNSYIICTLLVQDSNRLYVCWSKSGTMILVICQSFAPVVSVVFALSVFKYIAT